MWVVKFRFDGSNMLYGSLCKKNNVLVSGYNLSSYEKGKDFILTVAGKVHGSEKDTKKLVKELKSDKRVLRLEEKNNFVLFTIKEDMLFKPFSSHLFIYVSPAIVDRGMYTFHIASWDRKDVENLLVLAEKFKDYKLMSFKEEIVDNISISGIQPNLTDKQKNAYELAVMRGYYEFPKKITIKELAELSGVSYSTFQQHLSYAEKKIGRFFVGKVDTD